MPKKMGNTNSTEQAYVAHPNVQVKAKRRNKKPNGGNESTEQTIDESRRGDDHAKHKLKQRKKFKSKIKEETGDFQLDDEPDIDNAGGRRLCTTVVKDEPYEPDIVRSNSKAKGSKRGSLNKVVIYISDDSDNESLNATSGSILPHSTPDESDTEVTTMLADDRIDEPAHEAHRTPPSRARGKASRKRNHASAVEDNGTIQNNAEANTSDDAGTDAGGIVPANAGAGSNVTASNAGGNAVAPSENAEDTIKELRRENKKLREKYDLVVGLVSVLGPSRATVEYTLKECYSNIRLLREARVQWGEITIERTKEAFETNFAEWKRYLKRSAQDIPVRTKAPKRRRQA